MHLTCLYKIKKVNEFNERVHGAGKNKKYCIEAIDSVIGANSAQLQLKILGQIPDDPRKTRQIKVQTFVYR